MAFSITASNDSAFNNVVTFTFDGLTTDYGTIDFDDGQVTKIFPSKGQYTHTYLVTGSYTVTVVDPDSSALDDVAVTVSSVSSRPTEDVIERDSVVVKPLTSISGGAFQAELTTSSQSVFQGRVSGDATNRVQVDATGKVEWGGGSGAVDVALYRSAADVLATDDDLAIKTAGKGLQVKTGSNAKAGTLTANGTTGVVVSTTAVTANSLIFIGSNTPAGTPAAAYVSAVTPGTSFTVKSAASDTSTLAWMIVEPA